MKLSDIEAGRELDALLCQHLAIPGRSEFYASATGPGSGTFFSAHRHEVEAYIAGVRLDLPEDPRAKSEVYEVVHFPAVSAERAALWAVVEAMEKRGYWFELVQRIGDRRPYDQLGWFARFRSINDFSEGFAAADDAPLAVCMAALSALGLAK